MSEQSTMSGKRIFLIILALILFVGPVLFWIFLVSLGCAYSTNNHSCGPDLNDFFDWEFLQFAIIPWVISTTCVYFSLPKKKADAEE